MEDFLVNLILSPAGQVLIIAIIAGLLALILKKVIVKYPIQAKDLAQLADDWTDILCEQYPNNVWLDMSNKLIDKLRSKFPQLSEAAINNAGTAALIRNPKAPNPDDAAKKRGLLT